MADDDVDLEPDAPFVPRMLRGLRDLALVIAVGFVFMMIVGTALPVFILEASMDALRPPLNGLKQTSLVSPRREPLETTVMAQIRAHPAVERTVPMHLLAPLEMSVPLLLVEKARGAIPPDNTVTVR